jgi:hypothetical protein
MLQMVLYFYVAVAVFATLPKKPEDFFPALWSLVVIGSFLAVAGIATDYGFLGMNKNGIGASLSVAAIIVTELWFRAKTTHVKIFLILNLIIISGGLLLSLSRGAWIGTFLGMFILYVLRGQTKKVFRLALVLLPVLYVAWSLIPAEKRTYAVGFEKTRYNIKLRYQSLQLAQQEYEKNPVLGVGAGLRKEYDATNIAWLTLAETGILGFVTFFSIQGILIVILFRTQRRVLRSDPLFTFLALAGALTISRLGHGMVDHYWSRGAITVAWASVGMATYAIVILQQRQKALRQAADRELLAQRQLVMEEIRNQRIQALPPSSSNITRQGNLSNGGAAHALPNSGAAS